MIKRIAIIIAMAFILSACGSNNPSEDDIREALSQRMDTKGCVTSVLFKDIPIQQEKIGYNQSIIDAMTAAQLITKAGDAYELTDLGKSAYDKDYQGFCYTDNYDIQDIAVVKSEDKTALAGTPLSGAWYVSFTISPSAVDEWVNVPQIMTKAKEDSMTSSSDSKSYTVRFAKKAGDEKLFIADPRFSFHPSIVFNMGF